jgi:hypothetical protein
MRYAFVYPLLQPVGEGKAAEPGPFSACGGGLRLRAFQEGSGLGTLEEDFLGQALLPVRWLVEAAGGAQEWSGWLDLTHDHDGGGGGFVEAGPRKEEQPDGPALKPSETAVSLFVRARLALPDLANPPSKVQVEESKALEAIIEDSGAAQAG